METLLLRLCGIGLLISIFFGCKTPSGTVGESELNKFESSEFDGKNVCELMAEEAFEDSEDKILDVEAKYVSIREREISIYEHLIETIDDCKNNETLPVTPGPKNQDISCETIDPKRKGVYLNRLHMANKCPDLESAFTAELGEALKFDPEERKKECDKVKGDLPEWFDEECRVDIASLGEKMSFGQAIACDMMSGLLAVSGSEDAAFASCRSQPVVDVCGKIGAIKHLVGFEGKEKLIKSENQKLVDSMKLDLKTLSKDFNRATRQCLAAFAVPALKKHGITSGVREVSAFLFKQATNQFIKGAAAKRAFNLKKFIALSACEYSTKAIAAKVATKPKFQDEACSREALKWDHNQTAACLQTASDQCASAAGIVDFTGLTNLDDEQVLARTAQAITEGGISAACSLGGTASQWACGTIAKSSGYIRDAFKGKSNPWADCAGTTKLGRCVGQKMFELGSGIKTSDLKVAIDPVKKSDNGKRSKLMCWCWQKCYKDHRWPKSNAFFNREFRFYPASRGAAGRRLCKAQEKKYKYKGKFEGVNVLYYISDCEVVSTRQPDSNGPYAPPGGQLEIFSDNKWGTYNIPDERYACSHR